jgi:glycogen operon protein
MSEEPVDAPLPDIAGRRWHVALDTGETSPHDLVPCPQQQHHPAPVYRVGRRSVAVFEAR